jgi:hypothetical protein
MSETVSVRALDSGHLEDGGHGPLSNPLHCPFGGCSVSRKNSGSLEFLLLELEQRSAPGSAHRGPEGNTGLRVIISCFEANE